MLGPLILEGFSGYLRAESIEAAFREFNRFRVLCALRRGPFGSEGINRLVEEILTAPDRKEQAS